MLSEFESSLDYYGGMMVQELSSARYNLSTQEAEIEIQNSKVTFAYMFEINLLYTRTSQKRQG